MSHACEEECTVLPWCLDTAECVNSMLLEGSTAKVLHLIYGKLRYAGGSKVRRLVIVERVEVTTSSHGCRRGIGRFTAKPVASVQTAL